MRVDEERQVLSSVNRWLRWYGTALMLTMSVLGQPPDGRLRDQAAMVRVVDDRRQRWDDREVVGGAVVVTVPYEARAAGETPVDGRRRWSLN